MRGRRSIGCAAMLAALLSACSSGDGDSGAGSGGSTDGGGASGGSDGSGASGSSGGSGGSGASGGSGGGADGGAGSGGAQDIDGSAPDGGGTLTPEQFWSQFSQALCHHYFHCVGEPYARPQLKAMAGDESRCAQAVERTLLGRPSIRGLNTSVAAGVLHIGTLEAERCLAATRQCRYPLPALPAGEISFDDVLPCREVFDGNVPEGGACEIHAECAGEARCKLGGDEVGPSCYGTCVARVAADQPCGGNQECAGPPPPALAWPMCTDGKCEVPVAGAPAGQGSSCGPSATVTPCADDLWCDAQSLQCSPVPSLGEPCTVTSGCSATTSCKPSCLDGACVDGQCTAYTVRKAVNDPCDSASVPCDAFSSLICVNGSCVATDGATDSACSKIPWYGATVCSANHKCGTTGHCMQIGDYADGQPCTLDDDCTSGHCEFRTRVCVPALCSAR